MNSDSRLIGLTAFIRQHFLPIALLAMVIWLMIFRGLGEAPLLQWDESRRAVNAIEMLEQGSWIVPYYEGSSDQWAAKPTLLPVLQRISIQVFGISEWAVRLPVALFATGTVILVFLFTWYLTASVPNAFIAAFVLLATPGFVHYHVSVTGDYDGLLIFFILLGSFAFFVAIEDHEPGRVRNAWWVFGLALALGTLSKSIAAWLYTPGLVLYIALRNKWPNLFMDKRPWLAGLLAISLIGGYYFTREWIDPGYLKAVWDNEMGGRYLSTLEGHEYPWSHYLDMLFTWKFVPWYLFIPFAIFMKKASRKLGNGVLFLMLCSLVQLIVVSNSSTKLSYYEAPAYPWLAIVAAIGLYQLLDRYLSSQISLFGQNLPRELSTFLVFGSICILPLLLTLHHKSVQLSPIPETRIGSFVRDLDDQDNYFICHHGYSAHDIFYQKMLQYQGKNVRMNAIDYLKTGDALALCEWDHWQRLDKWFQWELISGKAYDCALVRIGNSKK